MKKIFTCFTVLLLCLVLASCGSMPDMRELLLYQQDGAGFHVNITDGELCCSAVITLGSTDTVELLDEGTSGVRFLFDEEKTQIEYDGSTMELSSADHLKAAAWVSLFSLSTDNIWKIRKDTIGGIQVYICSCGDLVLYIDAASRLPLKITDGAISIDVLSCELP